MTQVVVPPTTATEAAIVLALVVIVFAVGAAAGMLYTMWVSARARRDDTDEHDPYR